MRLDRRDFLRTGVVGAAAAAVGCSGGEPEAEQAAPVAEKFSKPLGAQLYTLRFVLPDNPGQVLKDLAAIGYEEAEVLQATFAEHRPLIEAAGLKPTSMHLVSSVVTGVWGDREKPEKATIEEAAAWAAEAGLSYVVMPYLGQEERGTDLDHYKRLAEKLQAAGEAANAAGVKFAYHNHAFEFEPIGDSTPLETLLANTDPKTVGLELDLFWVSVAGEDPVDQLHKHAGRVPLVHLKDKAAECPQQYKEGVAKEFFKEVGNGSLDYATIIQACGHVGVEHFFVEQDQTPGDPLASLKQSYDYLRSLPV